MKTSLKSVAAAAALALSATAPAQAGGVPAGLEAVAAELEAAWGAPPRVESLDMNMSGAPEVLLAQPSGCAPEGCGWSLHEFRDGSWREVHAGIARSVTLVATEPAGGLLDTDGITWALDDDIGLHVFGDILSFQMDRSPQDRDLEAVARAGFDGVRPDQVMAWTFEANAGEGTAFYDVVVINAIEHMQGVWGVPYVISDADGEVLLQGYSMDMPRIFVHADDVGFTVVDMVPVGMMVSRWPPGTEGAD